MGDKMENKVMDEKGDTKKNEVKEIMHEKTSVKIRF